MGEWVFQWNDISLYNLEGNDALERNKSGAMERLHILDKCMLPLWVWKLKLNLYTSSLVGGKSYMDRVYDIFQDRNISFNLFPHITYDI